MASYRKLRSGKWQVRWHEPGGIERSRAVPTSRLRDELLRAVTRCEALGIRYEPAPRSGAPEIGDAMNAYVEHLQVVRAPETVRQYRFALAMFAEWLAASGLPSTVADLSRDMLVGWYAHLAASKRAAITKKRLVMKVEKAWRWLFDEEWHPTVPRPRVLGLSKPARGAVVAPSWAEMAACVSACVSEGPRRLATLLYYTGERVGALWALDWSAVDFDAGTIAMPPNKGLPGRLVPMGRALAAELATWGRREGRVVAWSVVRQLRDRVLREAWKRAGVREVVWRQRPAHAFRRGVITGLKARGVDREVAEVFVGHAVAGTRGHYLDVSTLPLREAADAVPVLANDNVKRLAAQGVK